MASDVADFFECLICLERFINPKQLECYHHYCKTCLDGILSFHSDGSATIDCPRRCAERTCIGAEQTTNNLRVSYEFKGAIESIESIESTASREKSVESMTCQYEINCNKDIVLYCCGVFMCRRCSVNHETSQQQHHEKTCVYLDERENKVNVLCPEHLTGCTHVCADDDGGFLCVYCRNRSHEHHKMYTIEQQSSFVKQALVNDSEKEQNIMESIKLTEKEMLENKKKLDKSLRERKVACLRNYIAFLNEEEDTIKEKFRNVYVEHIKQYPLPNPPGKPADSNLLKKDIQLVIERISIAKSLAATNRTNSQVRDVTLKLSEEFNFRDMRPLGELQLVFSEDVVSFDRPPTTTLKAIIGEIDKYENILLKFNEQLDELLKECDEATRVRKSMDVKLNIPSPNEVADKIKNSEQIESNTSPGDKSKSTPVVKKRFSFTPKPKTTEDPEVSETHEQVLSICTTRLEEDGINYIEELIRDKKNNTLKSLLAGRPGVVSLRSPQGEYTPLLLAAKYNNTEILRVCLQYGESAERTGTGRVTALHLATLHDSVACVEWLLTNHRQLIDTTTDFGNTSLHLAAVKGNVAPLKLLLKYGANTQMANNAGCTPLASARTVKGNNKCIKVLMNALS